MSDIIENSIEGITYLERPGDLGVMVFLHGIGSNAFSFEGLMTQLPKGIRAISWNAPGYGGSRQVDPNWPNAVDYADALNRILRALGVSCATLIGHSLGTLIGAAFAKKYPDMVDQLILASCACGYGVAQGATLPANVASRIEELDLKGAAAFATERAPRLVFEPRLHRDVVARVQNAMSQVDRAGYAQAAKMLASGDLPGCLQSVTTPTGFIVGINDRVTPEQQTLNAARAWTQSTGQCPQIHRINHAGHAVYLQKPDEFMTALLALHQSEPVTQTYATTIQEGET